MICWKVNMGNRSPANRLILRPRSSSTRGPALAPAGEKESPQRQHPERPQAEVRDPPGIGGHRRAAFDLADQHAAGLARQQLRDAAAMIDDGRRAGVRGTDDRALELE